ncbi:SDR family NAD(P)-dependent oxidoreductase [Oscillatoria acuminata]
MSMETALITGASSGIGAAFARELARRHYNLILVARSQEQLNTLAQELRNEYPIQVEVIVQDLGQPQAATQVYQTVKDRGLTLDLLINNAGCGDYGPFASRNRSRQLEMIHLNIAALVELTHCVLPEMQQRRSGSIINVASIAGFQPLPYMSIYAASKAFVLSFSESLWAENLEFNLRIQALCPGPTYSNFFQKAGFPDPLKNTDKRVTIIPPEKVVQDSLRGLEKNQPVVVTGTFKAHIIVNLPRFFPRQVWVSFMGKMFKGGE